MQVRGLDRIFTESEKGTHQFSSQHDIGVHGLAGVVVSIGKSRAGRSDAGRSATSVVALLQRFMLRNAFFVHDKINHIQAFAVGLAASLEAVNRASFLIDLHRGRFVVVERAADPAVFVWFDAVMAEYFQARRRFTGFAGLPGRKL